MKTILYTYEFEDGTTQEWLIEFKINKFYPATQLEPEEGGDIDIRSITYKGVEVDVELDDKLYNRISEHIYNEYSEEDSD